MSEKSGLNRRHFLSVATSVAGAAGLGMAAVPFALSFKPSAKAQALGAPVQVDIGKPDEGQMVRSMWRGKPVWVLKRTSEMLSRMQASGAKLADPDSEVEAQQPEFAQNADRSLKPEILVVLGVCTHLGCAPLERFDIAPADLGPDWVGGFYCPCHGSKFDLSGRVYAGVPASANLVVPPYSFEGDNVLVIGVDSEAV